MSHPRIVRRTVAPIKYQPTGSELVRAERIFARLVGCRSEGAAHTRMLRARREFECVIAALNEAGAWGRVPTFIVKVMALSQQRPPVPLSEALTLYARKDGEQDGDLVAFSTDPDNEQAARTVYLKTLAERGAADDLLLALQARFGFGA